MKYGGDVAVGAMTILSSAMEFSMLPMLTLGLVMLFPRIFAGIFSPDANLIKYTGRALRIYCAGMGIFGAQVACQMTFTSLGNAKASIMVAVMRKFVLLLPLIYIMPHLVENQTMGVYLAEPVADFISVAFTVILFYFQFRKAMKQLEIEEKEVKKGESLI